MSKIGFHLPKGSLGRTVLSLVITALIGFVYFYVSLPAINPHSSDFYSFLGLLCVVYVICDPATLARDAKFLCAHSFQALRCQSVDMFCQTGHVDTVCLFSKKKANGD